MSAHTLVRGSVRRTALVLAASAIFGVSGSAAAQTVLRVGQPTTEDSGYGVFAESWAEKVAHLTNGEIEIKPYHNGQLGDEKALVEALRLGTVEGGIVTTDVLINHVPEFAALSLPFAFKSYEDAHDFLDGEAGAYLLSRLEAVGLKGFAFADVSFRSIGNNIRPIKTPDDMQGLKLRVIQSPIPVAVMNALGAQPTPIAWGETIPALKQGIVDGLATGNAYYYIGRVYDYTKYFSFTNHAYSAMVAVLAKSSWDGLNPAQQASVARAAEEAALLANAVVSDVERVMVPEITAAGTEVNRISDATPFREAVLPLWDEQAGKVGDELMIMLRNHAGM